MTNSSGVCGSREQSRFEGPAHIERPPAALAVIIPSGPVIRRTDGVWVIPLAALRP